MSACQVHPNCRFLALQLLNCYYEAYQHAAGTEERCALARVITDIMHSRPQLDLNQDYFVQVYRAEIGCLRSHQQLIKNILDNQVKSRIKDAKICQMIDYFDNLLIISAIF